MENRNSPEASTFTWDEKRLNELAEVLKIGKFTLKNDYLRIKLEDVEFPAKKLTLSLEEKLLKVVDEEFEKLINNAYDPLMNFDARRGLQDDEKLTKCSSDEAKLRLWDSRWKKIAEKFQISYIDCISNSHSFRLLHVIPHVLPVVVIAKITKSEILILYGKDPDTNTDIPLETFLRYSYSNLPQGDVQSIHFLTKSLCDLYSQLYSRGVSPIFSIDNFQISPSLWLYFDVFRSIVDKIGRKVEKKPEISLEEATKLWVHRKMNNYEYLLFLNRWSGRKRGQIQNHPIFPWVCDFSSKNGGFRALNRTKYRLAKGDDQLKEMFSREPSHHVPELLSDIGYMAYRARIETKENLCKHVRRKWVPEEYCSTIRRMYEWTPDECIPEFYEDENIFVSRHSDMADLKIPDFVNSGKEFVTWHRSMLESEEVSSNLHRWIDLVFGYLLDPEESKNALNLHLCFVEKNRNGFRTSGMVKLFDRPHPERVPGNYKPKTDCYRLEMNSFGFGTGEVDDELENLKIEAENEESESLFNMYKKLKQEHRIRHSTHFNSMVSLIEVIAHIVMAPYSFGHFHHHYHNHHKSYIIGCIRKYSHAIPFNYSKLFEYLIDKKQEYPNPDEFSMFVMTILNIPINILDFHDEFSKCMSYHTLRDCEVIPKFSKRSQVVLLREVDSLKKSIRICYYMEKCVVAAFQKLLEDEEASIHAVHRLMSVIARSISQSSLEDLIAPMIELIQCGVSVKLLDRRFLLYISICYGTDTFLDLFLPPIVEACASRSYNRSIVAKESMGWLAKRYGPVICAKFISSNLLRIMASCYEGLELYGEQQEPTNVFNLTLVGDDSCARIESLLSEIVITYSVVFVTVQFLPFCVDLIEQYHKRSSAQLEPGLLSVFRIVELSIRSMTDHQLMNHLEEFIIQKVIYRVLTILLSEDFQFSSERARNVILCKALQLLNATSLRIGTENTRIYANKPFKLLFTTFARIYDTNEELRIIVKQRKDEEDDKTNTYQVPIWIVKDVIDKFSKEWGVPFLSSFCDDPAFLIPFVSNGASISSDSVVGTSPPNTFSAYSLHSMPSGNRLFSLSSSSPASSHGVSSGGGVSYETGSLSAIWCARVSSAVCGSKSVRFDHLSLCTFSGHTEKIRKLAAMSNENSFVSASSDKTVKLWSIKPEQDAVECQWTYRYHNRSVQDVIILADNAIASVDGSLHIWDPFRSTILAQLEWDPDGNNGGNIVAIENVDRHVLAAISTLQSSVKLFDTRVGTWTSELKTSPTQGLARAMAVKDYGQKMAICLSNGTMAIIDARMGKIKAVAHGVSTHTVCMKWLSDSQLLIADADENGIIVEAQQSAKVVKKLADTVTAADVKMGSLVTLQNNSMLRIYKNTSELLLETRIRSDELPGTPTAILPLPLNSSYLIGSSQGAIRLMC